MHTTECSNRNNIRIYVSLYFERNEIFYRLTRSLCTVAKINSLGVWIDRSSCRRKQRIVGRLVYSCCSNLEHRSSVKRFVSLQFLNLRHSVELLRRVISPSQGRYVTKTISTHPCIEWDSNPRSQRSSERRQFVP
jgi:hypothetical protein